MRPRTSTRTPRELRATRLRQSDLKGWQRCPLQWRFANIDQLPDPQTCASTFGSILHDCALHLEVSRDLPTTLARYRAFWAQPETLDPTLEIQQWLRGRSFAKYADEGERILSDWWSLIQWDADVVLAREHHFVVPIGGGHELEGTVDKLLLRYQAKTDEYVLVVSDYKSNAKLPSYDYLRHDLQFSAYSLATTKPQFWEGLPDGAHYFEQAKGLKRQGEWVHLRGPQRKDAGERTDSDYRRVIYSIDQMALSIGMRIFVPNIAGDVCRFCPFREPCGLQTLDEEEGLLPQLVT